MDALKRSLYAVKIVSVGLIVLGAGGFMLTRLARPMSAATLRLHHRLAADQARELAQAVEQPLAGERREFVRAA